MTSRRGTPTAPRDTAWHDGRMRPCDARRLLRSWTSVLVAFQDAFVALAADAALRARFARDPDAALGAFALTPRERAALRAIPLVALERYARALVAKRWDELARVVPLTVRVVPTLESLYRVWAAHHPARGEPRSASPGIAEALRAERAMFERLVEEPHAPYAAELWRFEIARATARRDGASRTLRTRFAIHEIADAVARGLLPVDPPPRATEVRCERDRVSWRDV